MIIHLIKFLFLSLIFSTRFFNENLDITLDNNRSCAQRPNLENTLISPSGNFLIHYDNTYEGIAEYAYQVSIAADSSQKVIVDLMNFRNHVQDSDDVYDIYIKDLCDGCYGYNCLENELGVTWIVVEDNFIGSNYITSGLDAMKITVAHEYFHAIQTAYVPYSIYNKFFYELSSMWIEDIVYPEIDDYVYFSQSADEYFENPELNMNEYNGYGLGLYGHYMNYEFGDSIMQRLWNEYASLEIDSINNQSVYNIIDSVLSNEAFEYNSSFTETWLDFNTKNLFNGISQINNNLYYYDDQKFFNPINSEPIQIQTTGTTNVDLFLNNRSVQIDSFEPESLLSLNIVSNLDSNYMSGNFALISNFSEVQNIKNSFNSYIIDENDIFHTVHISNLNNAQDSIKLYSNPIDLNFSNQIYVYPNPSASDLKTTILFSSGIKSNNILLKIYNLNGNILKKINLGSINYTTNDYNEISVNIFDHNFTSGIYILSFELDDIIINKKITLLK
tara:strand:+ start:1286 stop:2791 length:1506 start_codon:yes stop_codon:yes gene_type:complete